MRTRIPNAGFTFHAALFAAGVLLASVAGAGEPPRGNRLTEIPGVASGGRLSLDLDTGASVHITGWKRGSVQVDCPTEGCPYAVVSVRETRNGVTVETHHEGMPDQHGCSLAMTIHVPEKFDVSLQSVGGSLDITEVEGRFEGMTGGGGIHLTRVAGYAKLWTGGGGISIADSRLAGHVNTGGGKIERRGVTGGVTTWSGSEGWSTRRDAR